MNKQFRCSKCGHRLFDVVGGEPTTALEIKCPKCKTIISFDFRKVESKEPEKKEETIYRA